MIITYTNISSQKTPEASLSPPCCSLSSLGTLSLWCKLQETLGLHNLLPRTLHHTAPIARSSGSDSSGDHQSLLDMRPSLFLLHRVKQHPSRQGRKPDQGTVRAGDQDSPPRVHQQPLTAAPGAAKSPLLSTERLKSERAKLSSRCFRRIPPASMERWIGARRGVEVGWKPTQMERAFLNWGMMMENGREKCMSRVMKPRQMIKRIKNVESSHPQLKLILTTQRRILAG